MVLLVVALAILMICCAQIDDNVNHLFDIQNTNAMRGFWCIIVVIGHTPLEYVNKVQDLILCFGYIGITFFFMTSGFGLALSQARDPQQINCFWRKHLPKLVISCWILNIFNAILCYPSQGQKSFISLFKIDIWVIWLLVCYFFFWIMHKAIRKKSILCETMIMICIVAFSVTIYMIKLVNNYSFTAWITECYGFIWGILLARYHKKFYDLFIDRWEVKLTISLLVSLVLGIGYICFKPVAFWGDYLLKIILGLSIITFILISNVKISYGNKINQFLARCSFEIYLVHGSAYEVVKILSKERLSSGMFIWMSIIVSVILACIAHEIIKKILSLSIFHYTKN
ncbi:Acyltransferase family [Butyrivibrio fibrisolvens 16/4]|nr:Acyltransferase family [Butyrivibrio fibrisolvens 16/4]